MDPRLFSSVDPDVFTGCWPFGMAQSQPAVEPRRWSCTHVAQLQPIFLFSLILMVGRSGGGGTPTLPTPAPSDLPSATEAPATASAAPTDGVETSIPGSQTAPPGSQPPTLGDGTSILGDGTSTLGDGTPTLGSETQRPLWRCVRDGYVLPESVLEWSYNAHVWVCFCPLMWC